MKQLGATVARHLKGGECIELIGDVGAGKTTFVQGLGLGLGADDTIQSPSFTISREYHCRDGLRLAHYDFYRLTNAGVMSYELAESLQDQGCITVVEWASTISAVLPREAIKISIESTPTDETRIVTITGMTL
ncbi:MAG: tRNA (adenosine(37)-N6)-threonylcarbamoyltransferase complex ATPase subunit type 1 TsaE [Candidatus Saccharimonadales bacterium]